MKNKDINKLMNSEEFPPFIAVMIVSALVVFLSFNFFSETDQNIIKIVALVSFIISFLIIEYFIFISMEKKDDFVVFLLFNFLNVLASLLLIPSGLLILLLVLILTETWKGIVIVIGSLSMILLLKYLMFKVIRKIKGW